MLRLPRISLFALLFLFHSTQTTAQIDSVRNRIILVGDAGMLTNGTHPELNLVKKAFNVDDKKNTVVFLGDNIYPLGLPSIYSSSYESKRKVLDNQVNLVRGTQATAYIIPGNHDWARGRPGGWQQILNQGNYINSLQLDNVHFLPQDGCPGPEEIHISDKVVLVIIDSQWWLQQYDKPGVRSGCESTSEEELLASIQDVVDRNRNKLMIFASHHPFVTYGRHGGFYGIKQHIFPLTEVKPNLYIPLPVLGSIYPIVRGVFGDIQDTKHPIYKNYSSKIDSILKQHPYCIRVAGHEHNLQLIKLQNQFYIVSGAGAKQSETTKGAGTVYSDNGPGFSVIETLIDGGVRVSLFSNDKDTTGKPIFSMRMPGLDTTPVKAKQYVVNPFPDSVTFKGYDIYKAGKFKRWLLGKNYREEWTQPIRVKVFDIGKEHGGLTPTRRGGGMQTKSLRLQDSKGNEYVLRTIEKFPDNTLPEEFRATIVRDAVVDGISASYPYAALSVPPLADAAGVQYAYPRLVYVPDDPRLGYYQTEFANTLCIYEEREPGNYDRTYSTEKVLERVREDNDDKVDQKYVLKARMFDMFIMDFDRHEDQWRWGTRDTGRGKIYYPIPRDRDQAFFVNNGVIPAFVRKPYIFPKFQGFRAKAININTFNFNARFFDRSFLYALNENDWKTRADTLMQQMIDGVIDYALTLQPKEIQQYNAPKIVETLKKRKQYFQAEAMEYYRFLAKNVDIPGSDKHELFQVQRFDNGDIKLEVFKITKEGVPSGKLMERTFKFNETKEVRLYGFDGQDRFVINGTGKGKKTIRLRLIGGDSIDVFENNSQSGPGRTIVYDRLGETNYLKGAGVFRSRISTDPEVNELDRRAFKYNLVIPGVSVAYNLDDGIFLGARISHIKHGFRKEPHKLKHEFAANHALATKSFNFRYNLEFIDFAGKGDLVVDARLRAPRAVNNFFGLGNETLFDRTEGKTIDYYRTRYDQGDVAILIRNQVAEYVSVAYGPAFSYYSLKRNQNVGRFLYYPSINGLDSGSLYRHKSYGGGHLLINIDNRNDEILPSRGVLWKTNFRFNRGFGKYTDNSSQLNTDFSMFISSNSPTKLVIAARFGAGWSYGNFEFFQAQYLGGTDNLRGFRRERFAGYKKMFNNLELRYQIKEVETYLFPGAIGILVFHDIGRVWMKNENSKTWHRGYGAGVWAAPAKRAVLTLSYTRSREGALPLATFGYQF